LGSRRPPCGRFASRSRRRSTIVQSPSPPRRLAYAALFVAAGLTAAYAESIPNFELITLTAFLSGMVLGVRDGALVGGACILLYSLLNPYGPAHPLVTASQVVGEAVAGAAGGLAAKARLDRRPRAVAAAVFGLAALALTAFYDVITNLATGLVFGQTRFWLVAGIPFALWHIGWNVALFVAIGTALVGVIPRYAARLS